MCKLMFPFIMQSFEQLTACIHAAFTNWARNSDENDCMCILYYVTTKVKSLNYTAINTYFVVSTYTE